MSIDLQHTVNETIKIARRTGEFIRHEGKHFDKSKIEEKGLNNLVSYVDKEAEKMIVQTLTFTLPEAGFITEEGTASEKAAKYNWVIDPLDGTTNFMHGLPPYSVSIALLENDRPLLGVVYIISSDECYHAVRDGGAFCNLEPIHVSKVTDLKDGLFITGIPYTNFEKLDNYWKIFGHFTRYSHGIRRLGSAAADLAYVAAGKSEGFFEDGLHPWDVAAAALLVTEAGGIVTDYKGGDDYIFGKGIIAGCAVQLQMLEIISKYW